MIVDALRTESGQLPSGIESGPKAALDKIKTERG